MQIETASQATTIGSINSYYPANAIASIEMVFIAGEDYIVCGMDDGKILQMCLDTETADKIVDEPQHFPP